MIIAIVAAAENDVIGNKGRLPWHLGGDLRHFRETTMGNMVVMGRLTYESLPRALEGRQVVVLSDSRRVNFPYHPNDIHVKNREEAIELFRRVAGEKDVFIAGGGQVYSLFSDVVHRVIMTRVHVSAEGDTFFPSEKYGINDPERWDLVDQRESKKHGSNLRYTIMTYDRRK